VVKIDKPRVSRNGVLLDTRKIGVTNAVREVVDFLDKNDLL
jgi:hypothetical protein